MDQFAIPGPKGRRRNKIDEIIQCNGVDTVLARKVSIIEGVVAQPVETVFKRSITGKSAGMPSARMIPRYPSPPPMAHDGA